MKHYYSACAILFITIALHTTKTVAMEKDTKTVTIDKETHSTKTQVQLIKLKIQKQTLEFKKANLAFKLLENKTLINELSESAAIKVNYQEGTEKEIKDKLHVTLMKPFLTKLGDE